MFNALPLTIVGNLTADPELRFTPDGVAVARFTVAHTPRRSDGAGGWTDGEATFMDCTAWRSLAENVAESVGKGARVIVAGRLVTQRWEKDGEKRSRLMLDVDAIGPDLMYATAKPQKTTRRAEADPSDPWATASRTRPASSAASTEPGA